MKRNTALFGASLVAGVAAATGLVMTSTPSSAASTYYGVNWQDGAQGTGSSGWTSGAYGDADTGSFWGTASAGKGTFQTVLGSQVSVSVTCDGADPVTTVTGGGAPGTYHAGDSVTLAKFIGAGNAIGSVEFGKDFAGHTAGAYIDLTPSFGGYVALTGADCEAAPTSSSTTPSSSSSTTPSSSSTTNPPTSSTTNPPTSSTTNPPTSSTTAPPTSTPPTTPPPTTEPPTPTPTTTTLPVTG